MSTASDSPWPRHTRVLSLVTCAAFGCGGTPTADPPDFLPTPSAARINVGPEVVSTSSPDSLGPIDLVAGEGAVDGAADLWIVNLDRLDADAQIIKPKANGSFSAEVEASVGDRVRLVSRTEDRHSLPLDLEAVRGFDIVALSPLQDQGLACLEITPNVELDLGDDRKREASFVLDNKCSTIITIERAVLRFDSPNTALTKPTTVAQDAAGKITIKHDGELPEEQWDILLLDVSAGEQNGRYALSVWAR